MTTATHAATDSPACARRLASHMLATLISPERATVTNFICAGGGQHADWSADYRLYSRGRVDADALFDAVREPLLAALAPGAPLVVALDDTLVRKSGRLIDGVRWRRDPLGPPFQTNLVRGQRYLQLSALWPLSDGSAPAVPLDFHHIPGAAKPAKDADPAALRAHREEQKQKCLNTQALLRMARLRERCPAARRIDFVGDGSYTNAAVIKGLPAGSVYIGRARKDIVLHHPPTPSGTPAGKGRPRRYGDRAPTPEALRTDDTVPWESVPAHAAGTRHEFRVKTLGAVHWRNCGTDTPMRVVVVAPLGYRLKKGGKLLYRQPAYLVCTDPGKSVAEILQEYLHRWGIEVNFRDEKTLVGTGEAQVRTAASNATLPAATVAAYAMLRVAALMRMKEGGAEKPLRAPKWRRPGANELPATGELIRLLRYEVFSPSIRPHIIEDFVKAPRPHTTSQKIADRRPDLPAILFCAA